MRDRYVRLPASDHQVLYRILLQHQSEPHLGGGCECGLDLPVMRAIESHQADRILAAGFSRRTLATGTLSADRDVIAKAFADFATYSADWADLRDDDRTIFYGAADAVVAALSAAMGGAA